MRPLVLDTDVASRAFKKLLPPDFAAKLVQHELCITFVTIAEMAQWAEWRQWGLPKRHALTMWQRSKARMPGTEKVARMWGEISGRARARGTTAPHNDTWIAACCLVYDAPLATFNVKDFAQFEQYEGLQIVTT